MKVIKQTFDPRQNVIQAAYEPGKTVSQIAKLWNATYAINFNFANTDNGQPIGLLRTNGKLQVQDSEKTLVRDSLFQDRDGTLHIGKPNSFVQWSVQGSPPLIKDGIVVVKEGIERDKTPDDIAKRPALRTAVGITEDNELVVIRTQEKVLLEDLAVYMLQLGCVQALNGDGGGSSYFWPYDSGWSRDLGSALVIKQINNYGGKPMAKKIALCDGHGMETIGKRTPLFPDGSFMHENEFNRAVVAKLDVHLKRCGFETLLVAPTDQDTPLHVRTSAANLAKCDFYLSVHANATGGGEWNSVRGIETFIYPGSTMSRKPAEIIQRHLVAGTALPNRGVKEANFQVLRETKMPAALVECAFMTNHLDAALLLTETYREECAVELAKAMCEIFNVKYVPLKPPTIPTPVPTPTTQSDTVTVLLNGVFVGEGKLENGTSYLPVRRLAEAMGLDVKWDQATKTVNLTTKG